MQKYKINDEKFQELCTHIKNKGFISDGCDCGTIIFQLKDELYITLGRSCRRSSCCDNPAWQLDDKVEFYKKIPDNDFSERDGEVESELDEEQLKEILRLAKIRTIKELGYDEFWNKIDYDRNYTNASDITCPFCFNIIENMNEVFSDKEIKDGEEKKLHCNICDSDFKVTLNISFTSTNI